MPKEDKFKALQAELGKAYKERDDLKRQVDDLRFQLNFGKQFPGDSKALLTATYKAEYYPSQEQLYAAKVLLEKEYPPNAAGEYKYDETGKVVLFLPHNARDSLALHEDDPNRQEIARQLERLAREDRRKRTEQLQGWVKAGKMCDPCAMLAHSQFIEEGDAPWDAVQPGNQAQNGQECQRIEARAADMKSHSQQQPQRQPNGHAQPEEVRTGSNKIQRGVLLFTQPDQEYETLGGVLYVAGNDGSIWVDEADVQELRERLGARDRR
jgi:hypothetical protein